ncbi:MAG: alpha/beta hydrolase-fold protein [Bacteroidota bacterium]
MKTIILTSFIGLLGAFSTVVAQGGNPFELPRTEVVPITDTQHSRQYELYIKLPAGYTENQDRQYPVLYYTDAIWHIEMLNGTMEYLIEDAILVGISWQKDADEALVQERGAHVSRFRDYSVVPSSNPERQAKYQFGKASEHLDFIADEVIQYVDAHYRTDSEVRAYFGYSLGGVFGAYALLAQPDIFTHYILGSPALQGDIPYFTELEANTRTNQEDWNAHVFITYGSLEEELGQHADAYISLLHARDDERISLITKVIEGTHQTAFPLTTVQGVTWLSGLLAE